MSWRKKSRPCSRIPTLPRRWANIITSFAKEDFHPFISGRNGTRFCTTSPMKKLDLAPNTRFLLVRPDKIGDVLLTTPSVMSLRKRYPDSYMGFLCRSYTAPLLENNPAIDRVFQTDDP